jgi:hypothetical protein
MDKMNQIKLLPDKDKPYRVILAEIIGATGLQLPIKRRGPTTESSLNPFVLASLYEKGSCKQILRKTESQRGTCDPIFCIEHKCVFLLSVPNDVLSSEHDSLNQRVQFEVRNDDAGNYMKCSSFGSASISLQDIVYICSERPEERIELQLQVVSAHSRFRLEHSLKEKSLGKITCNDGPSSNVLAVRFRFASSFDMTFVQDLENEERKMMKDKSIWSSARKLLNDTHQISKCQDGVEQNDNPKFITEMGVQEVGVDQLMRMFTKKSKRGKDGILRIRVQPGPDPKRESDTTFLSEEEMLHEMFQPSSNWIECGTDTKESLGTVYLEILRCEGLPNMDSGESFGNKTDAFVCAIFEESLVQTDVIDDRLSPMWMPWSQRAFCFHIRHPLSQMFISVNDFDLGPTGHEGIGKIVVNLNHFEADVVYTLKYKIHPASNIYDREVSG